MPTLLMSGIAMVMAAHSEPKFKAVKTAGSDKP
jgi:hypothetical protein